MNLDLFLMHDTTTAHPAASTTTVVHRLDSNNRRVGSNACPGTGKYYIFTNRQDCAEPERMYGFSSPNMEG